MPAAGQVDLDREEVRLGDRAWPIVLDCRANTVSVTLGAGQFELRPIRWGEKRNLARFTQGGEAFLTRHFVQLCLSGEAHLPEDQTEREVLWTLARWITTPDETAPTLPLDSAVLLRAALDVAARLGCPAADLDLLPAAEVEMLWTPAAVPSAETPTPAHVASNSAVPAIPPVPEGMKRILVVPDVVPDPQPPATLSDPITVAHPIAPEAPDVPAAAPQAIGVTPAVPEAEPDRSARNRRAFGRIRVTMGGAPSHDLPVATTELQTAAAVPSAPAVIPERGAPVRDWPAFPALSQNAATFASPTVDGSATPSVVAALPAVSPTRIPSGILPTHDAETRRFSEPTPTRPAPMADPLDDWVEQIELAAEELGIEMEA